MRAAWSDSANYLTISWDRGEWRACSRAQSSHWDRRGKWIANASVLGRLD
jgi:hypothetical protein